MSFSKIGFDDFDDCIYLPCIQNVKCTCESRNITQEKGLSYFISRQKSQLLNPISTVL